jgi:hypothetical protein
LQLTYHFFIDIPEALFWFKNGRKSVQNQYKKRQGQMTPVFRDSSAKATARTKAPEQTNPERETRTTLFSVFWQSGDLDAPEIQS